MKYNVFITETLQRSVAVEADSKDEAEEIVFKQYLRAEHVLGADDFKEVNFQVKPVR